MSVGVGFVCVPWLDQGIALHALDWGFLGVDGDGMENNGKRERERERESQWSEWWARGLILGYWEYLVVFFQYCGMMASWVWGLD